MRPPNLVDCLDFALTDAEDEWGREYLHASDLAATVEGEGCLRQVWLRVHGAEERKPHLGERWMWDRGQSIHREIARLLHQTLPADWTLEHVEQSLTGLLPHGIRARTDGVLRHESGVFVLDFKSLRGGGFRWLDAGGPREGNVIQVQGYAAGFDAAGGVLLYADREGQNGFRQHFVERDDARVLAACDALHEAATAADPPPILEPKVTVAARVGDDAVYVEQPWQCSYCPLLNVSCPGALPAGQRDRQLIGHLNGWTLRPKPGMEDLAERVAPAVARKVAEGCEVTA